MTTATTTTTAQVMAGIPATNRALYRQMRFLVGDPAALITLNNGSGPSQRVLILRDIEMERARKHARADAIACPRDYQPDAGLSGDRETATAQATAEYLRRAGVQHVTVDRSLPMIFAHEMQQAGIAVDCDLDLGVIDRRRKDQEEIAHLREAQQATEGAMEMACRTVARATADAKGVLQHDGAPLTSERVRSMIDIWLLERGYENPASIVAGGSYGGDCHEHGTGELRTEQPVIIDIFPRNRTSLYNGDCTRTVVHGAVPDAVARMHAAVVEAKTAAENATRAGVTGEDVHRATIAVIEHHGYQMGLPPKSASDDFCSMQHGTGHGIGLEVHEPPLMDIGGPELVVGDALTIEPGLYSKAIGGVRIEDMVIVTADGCDNLNTLSESLDWS